jgi:HD superfamily phosphohydrolase
MTDSDDTPNLLGPESASAPEPDPDKKDADGVMVGMPRANAALELDDGERPDPTALVNETLLPVHGTVRLSPREMEVINHPAFQRLFEIFQLGQVHYVYRGATHMRGEHAIGALEVVTRMTDALERNGARRPPKLSENWQLGTPLTEPERQMTRLGALLHDVGHVAAGHTLEDELGVLAAHDADERLKMVLGASQWHGRSYRSLGELIDELYEAEAKAASPSDGPTLTAADIVLRLVSKDHDGEDVIPGSEFRFGVCRDLIGNTICADLLDYLHRDWLHLGKPRYFDERLFEYLEIRSRHVPSAERFEHKLVINLKGGTRPRPDAVTAVIDLLESRYQLAEIVLFHRVKVAAAAMLERIVAELLDVLRPANRKTELRGLLRELLECSDLEMLGLLEQRLARALQAVKKDEQARARLEGAIDLARRLRVRLLHKEFAAFYEDDLAGQGQSVRRRYNADPALSNPREVQADKQRAAAERLLALRVLEADFGLVPGSLVMYCPALTMNTKIAEVNVLLDGDVDKLAAVERRYLGVTGGHLAAQQERFRRLWRVTFAMERNALADFEDSDLRALLYETLEIAVLGKRPHTREPERALRGVAEELVRLTGSPWQGRELVVPASNRGLSTEWYPAGLPSLRAHIAG